MAASRSFGYMVQRIEELSDCIDPCFTVLVGNKIDCITEKQLDEEEARLSSLARKHKFRYYFSSANTGQNVNEIFEELGKSLFYNKTKGDSSTDRVDLTRKRRKYRWCFK